MVDKLLTLNDDVTETEFLIKTGNVFLDNNFFQESGLIENIAQTCSIIVGSSYFSNEGGLEENNSDVIGFISTIKTIDIYELPALGDNIISKGILVSRFDSGSYSICTMKGEIRNLNKLILECKLNLFIKKIDNEEE